MAINSIPTCGIVTNTGDPVRTCLNSEQSSIVAAGTAYALTATPAALNFGTTDPVLTLADAGLYELDFSVIFQFLGATFAASGTITFKIRRTNNTAADIAGAPVAIPTGIVTTLTTGPAQVNSPKVLYNATAGDILTIFGDVSVLPSAGSVEVTGAVLRATLYNPPA